MGNCSLWHTHDLRMPYSDAYRGSKRIGGTCGREQGAVLRHKRTVRLEIYTDETMIIRPTSGEEETWYISCSAEFTEVYKCMGGTDIDKTYFTSKQCIIYRKPRKI